MSRTPATTSGRSAAPAPHGAAIETLNVANDGYKIRFGVILDVNGKSVPITSDDLANAKANGVEFTLQEPVEIGSMADFQTWVSAKFGVTMPSAADLPSPLDKVVQTITNMVITVRKAHVKVPGSSSANQSVAVTLEVNGTFVPEIQLIQDKLGVQGLVFGFSNETPAA